MLAGASSRVFASSCQRWSERDTFTASSPKLPGAHNSMGPPCTTPAKASRGTECGWCHPERAEVSLCPVQHRLRAARHRWHTCSNPSLHESARSCPSACRPCSSGRHNGAMFCLFTHCEHCLHAACGLRCARDDRSNACGTYNMQLYAHAHLHCYADLSISYLHCPHSSWNIILQRRDCLWMLSPLQPASWPMLYTRGK